MDTYKINSLIVCGLLMGLLTSCGQSSTTEMISKEKYETKIEEYKELNKKQEAIINDNLEKNKVINSVVTELRELSGKTNVLRTNLEIGSAEVSQAEEIKLRLATIKKQLSSLPANNKRNKEEDSTLFQTIINLKKIIEEKETEIQQLQQQIAKQEEIIKIQEGTIVNQQEELLHKQDELLRKQQNSWYTLGDELYNVAGELPKVKGRKDKRNVKNTKYYILNKAKECFDVAVQLGHPQASSKRDVVIREMEKL